MIDCFHQSLKCSGYVGTPTKCLLQRPVNRFVCMDTAGVPVHRRAMLQTTDRTTPLGSVQAHCWPTKGWACERGKNHSTTADQPTNRAKSELTSIAEAPAPAFEAFVHLKPLHVGQSTTFNHVQCCCCLRNNTACAPRGTKNGSHRITSNQTQLGGSERPLCTTWRSAGVQNAHDSAAEAPSITPHASNLCNK